MLQVFSSEHLDMNGIQSCSNLPTVSMLLYSVAMSASHTIVEKPSLNEATETWLSGST